MKHTPGQQIATTCLAQGKDLDTSSYDNSSVMYYQPPVMFASSDSPDVSIANAPGAVPHRLTGLPSELMIGALVPPVLLAILVSRALADAMTQVGLMSEQFYRGERLPTLNMPPAAENMPVADSASETVGK